MIPYKRQQTMGSHGFKEVRTDFVHPQLNLFCPSPEGGIMIFFWVASMEARKKDT